MRACMRVCVCVCVAKPVAVELRCSSHATALILVIGKAQFRRAMMSYDSSCFNWSRVFLGGGGVGLGGVRVDVNKELKFLRKLN